MASHHGLSGAGLFRRLLRVSRALPDPVLRAYTEARARQRFERARPVVSPKRQSSLRAEGRKSLSLLRRAHGGDKAALGRIVALGYGRVGRLRHVFSRPARVVTVTEREEKAGPAAEKAARRMAQSSRAVDHPDLSTAAHRKMQARAGTGRRRRRHVTTVEHEAPPMPAELAALARDYVAPLPRWRRRVYERVLGPGVLGGVVAAAAPERGAAAAQLSAAPKGTPKSRRYVVVDVQRQKD